MPPLPGFLAALSVGDMVLLIVFMGAVGAAIRKAYKISAVIKDKWDDVFGEPERPGVPARPGLRADIAAARAEIAQTTALAQAALVAAESADHNTKPNGGSSSHDLLMGKLDEIEAQQAGLAAGLEGALIAASDHRAESGAWVAAVTAAAADHDFDVPPWPNPKGLTR